MELHIVEKKPILIQRCQMYLMDAPIVLGIASRLWLVIKPTVWFYAPSSLSEMALLILLSLPAQLSLGSTQQCWALWGCSEVNWSHVPVYLSLEHLVPHHGFFFLKKRKKILLWLFTFFHTFVVVGRKITLGFCDKCVRDEPVVYKLAYWTRIGFR